MKRKRAVLPNAVIPDGNYTPSDSDSDDEVPTRKIVRRASVDRDGASHSAPVRRDSNSQLLYAALNKIQELENELAELDEAGYDSGHQDDDNDDEDDNIDEGNASDFDESHEVAAHDHRQQIANAEPEALGFAFCVKETFDYLAAQGVTGDNPIVVALRERFLGQCDDA